MATHVFLEHTTHDKAYVCTECENIDLVTQRFQRHLLSAHSRSFTDVERFFKPCRSFTKLLVCTQPRCVFVSPLCEAMCTHQAWAHDRSESQRVSREDLSAALSEAGEEANDALFEFGDYGRSVVQAVEPPEVRRDDQPVMVVRPESASRSREVGPATLRPHNEEGYQSNVARLNSELEREDNRDRARFRAVEDLPPLPHLQNLRYFPIEKIEARIRPEDFRYLAQLTYGSADMLFVAMDELPPVGDSAMMRSRGPLEVICRIEVRQHRGCPGTMRPGHRCGATRPWRCSGPIIDTHTRPWGLVRRMTTSLPPPRGYLLIVNSVNRSVQDCRVMAINDY